jgi:uncharacterized membrane protein
MNKSVAAILLAGSLSLGACATNDGFDDDTVQGAATGAGIGAVAGAGVGAVVGGLSPLEGAVIGAAVGGVAGAVYADNDRDGRADGYVDETGTYYPGRPAGYNANAERCRSVLGGAAQGAGMGAVAGAGVGAVVGGINPLEGAIAGAVVGGIAGAVYRDINNDGCVDGYVTEDGRYHAGVPQPAGSSGYRAGERG